MVIIKKVFCLLLFVLFSPSLIVAASEITKDFVVDNGARIYTDDYIPIEGFWSVYGTCLIVILFFLIVILIVLNNKKLFRRKNPKTGRRVSRVRKNGGRG